MGAALYRNLPRHPIDRPEDARLLGAGFLVGIAVAHDDLEGGLPLDVVEKSGVS